MHTFSLPCALNKNNLTNWIEYLEYLIVYFVVVSLSQKVTIVVQMWKLLKMTFQIFRSQ
jgi:hypothetical protein